MSLSASARVTAVSYTHLDVYKRQGQAIAGVVLLARRGGFHRVVGGGQAAQVGDVLAQGQGAVDLVAGIGGVAVELLDQLAGAAGEGCLLYTSRCV